MNESFVSEMNESFFQDYSLSERVEERHRFFWTVPEIGMGNSDVIFYFRVKSYLGLDERTRRDF